VTDTTASISSYKESPSWLIQFIEVYENLTKHNLRSLGLIYHDNICFEDPIHKVVGYEDVIAYFEDVYSNVTSCKFEIYHFIVTPSEAAVYWNMHFQHPKLKSGENISIMGHSHLKMTNNKIIYHRDYYDLGEMLYENIAVLGNVIKFLKKRTHQ